MKKIAYMAWTGHKLEVISQIRLLGVVLTSDLKFKTNTEQMITRAYKKLWMLRRLKHLGATSSDLVDVYFKQIRSLVEYAVPVWQSSISQCERVDLERIQKSACHIILGKQPFFILILSPWKAEEENFV